MDFLKNMETYIIPIWNEKFSEDQTNIYNYFLKNQTKIEFDFCNYIVKGIVSDVYYFQTIGKQTEIAYLVIHFLKSSLLNRSYDYEIRLYNETLYLDETNISGYWYPEFLYQFAEDEELFLKKELQKKFVRIRSYEIELLRQKLFLQYWDIAKQYFQVLINSLLKKTEFKKVKTNGKLQILCGEHMGELEEL